VFSLPREAIPTPVRAVLRGVGQIFFQENALTGAFCVAGIAVSSPPMAAAAIAGSTIGMATARVLRFDQAEVNGGIYSFNATMVGIATLFFFRPGAASTALLVVSCVAALVTRLLRALIPVPTFTSPFFLTTWAIYLLGPALGAVGVEPEGRPVAAGFVEAAAHGISQALFQANVWTGILCVVGIALSDWRHATWAMVGSIVGIMVANYHVTTAARALDPERLIERAFSENIALGLYSYNTILPAIALFRWT
jgi:urea transporter